MSRYFLQLRDHTEETLDPEGVHCPSLDALREHVLTSARDLMTGDVRRGVIDLRFRIDAEDEQGAIVHTLPFKDAVRVISE